MATTDTTEFEDAIRKRQKQQVDAYGNPVAYSTVPNVPGGRPNTGSAPRYPGDIPGVSRPQAPGAVVTPPPASSNPFQKMDTGGGEDGDPYTPDPPPPPPDPTTPPDPGPQSPPPPQAKAETKTYADFGAAWQDSDYGPSPGELRALAADWTRDHPNDPVEVMASGGKIRYRGRIYDAIIAAGAGGTGKSWYDVTDGPGPGGGGSGDGGGGSGPVDDGRSAFWDAIKKRSLADPNADPNDPVIRAQTNAYRAEQTRAARDFQSQQAEANGAYYNPTGEARLSSERVGSATGAFQASLLAKRWSEEKAEIMQYAQMYGSHLTQQESNALQERLAALNNALQWAALQQNAEFHDDEEAWRRDPANPANRN